MVDEDEKFKFNVRNFLENEIKRYKNYLQIMKILKKPSLTEEKRKRFEESEKFIKESLTRLEKELELDKEGILEPVIKLHSLDLYLANRSIHINNVLENYKNNLIRMEKYKKEELTKKDWKEVKKAKKGLKKKIAWMEKALSIELEKESDPEWLESERERKLEALGLK